jgi:hypothetical protein
VRCPAFSDAIAKLHELRQFEWVYCDVQESGELPEQFNVCKLPAFVFWGPNEEIVAQNATDAVLGEVVHKWTRPVFRIDDDF